MESVVLSEKFQIVIPKEVRESVKLKPKEALAVWAEGEVISLTPLKKIKNPVEMMGSVSKKRIRISIEQLEKEIEEEYE